MNKSIKLKNYGRIFLANGLPPSCSPYLVPSAKAYHASGEWGTICIQEVATRQFSFQHILFQLTQQISLYCAAQKQNLRSIVSLDGHFEHQMDGLEAMVIGEREFLLFNSTGEEALLTAFPTKRSSVVTAAYSEHGYEEYISLFRAFGRDLKRYIGVPHYFTSFPKVARHSIHDAIAAIWTEKYIPTLTPKHIELKLYNSLFIQLAQTYTQTPKEAFTLSEKAKAEEARAFILKDITVHHLPEQVAAELFCSTPWLKKAFSKVYGVGLFQYLRKTRMMMARDMLLRGESLKVVALTVGMKPQNFPKEFKSFFGYTVTDLKQGQM